MWVLKFVWLRHVPSDPTVAGSVVIIALLWFLIPICLRHSVLTVSPVAHTNAVESYRRASIAFAPLSPAADCPPAHMPRRLGLGLRVVTPHLHARLSH